MPNNLILAQEPDTQCPYPIKWCGLKLCFEASDYSGGAAANAFIRFELDNAPWAVGSSLTIWGITFTVVAGAPTGPNQISSSANPATQWSNFYNALLSGITGGGQPFTDYYSLSSGYYITITSVAAGLNAPSPAGLFSGGVIVDDSSDGVAGATKSGYHVILDLYRLLDGNWEKVCGQYEHTYILPLQETAGGGNNVCFDISGALSVYPTPPPSDGSTWYLQANALAQYYARYAAFYRDEEEVCGNVYSGYEQTETFKVINAVFALTDPDGIAPYCHAASGDNALLLTDMHAFYEVCCNNPVWLSIYFDPEEFVEPVALEYVSVVQYAGGAQASTVLPIGSGNIAEPSLFTFLANPAGCELPEDITEKAFVQIELDEPDWTIGSTFTVFGLTLTVVAGAPGINELNADPNPTQQMTNLYNALLAAEISPGVPFTDYYNVSYGFYITITAISGSYNPPLPSGFFAGGIFVSSQNGGGGGNPTQVTVAVQIVGGAQIAQTKTVYLKSGDDCCCTTPLYFVGELGNIDYIEGSCTIGIDLEIEATTTTKPESCSDWINSGMWEVNNVATETQTCFIEVKREQEHYIRAFLKSVNKFWLDTDTGIYYRIIPAQKKYTLRKGADKVFIEFSFHVSYNLPNQLN